MKSTDIRAERRVRSADGTSIAYERSGKGPALILVEAAGHFRDFSSFATLAEMLANDFSVYRYDRRGRGTSTDTAPYAIQREVEDLAALVSEAGGSAFMYGFSSGGLLTLRAAAHGLAIPRLAVLEPPIAEDEGAVEAAAFIGELAQLVATDRRSDAVEHFHAGIGLPAEAIVDMRGTPAWSAMESVAPTLVYDAIISACTARDILVSVTAQTLVLDSTSSSDDLTGWAASVADCLPDGIHQSLPGEWHGVPDDTLAPVLKEFFATRRDDG